MSANNVEDRVNSTFFFFSGAKSPSSVRRILFSGWWKHRKRQNDMKKGNRISIQLRLPTQHSAKWIHSEFVKNVNWSVCTCEMQLIFFLVFIHSLLEMVDLNSFSFSFADFVTEVAFDKRLPVHFQKVATRILIPIIKEEKKIQIDKSSSNETEFLNFKVFRQKIYENETKKYLFCRKSKVELTFTFRIVCYTIWLIIDENREFSPNCVAFRFR